ncbi:MAG: hypothetical protein P8J33_12235 [Pirellulaceae bacterium]|nr:hypothetical protein [Pirellulaceae bacterium]
MKSGWTEQKTDELVQDLTQDSTSSKISPGDAALLEYAKKLTQHPAGIEAADIDKLRVVGWDDQAIHDLCAIVSYFAFANRIASGLGIELEKS